MNSLLKLAARLFLCFALAGAVAAQDQIKVDWQAWDGAPAPWKNDTEAARTVAEYRAWLADLRVKLLTGRLAEVPGWQLRLGTIRLHATSARGLPAQRELLVEVAQTRARLFESQGRPAEARAALDALLLAPDDPDVAEPKTELVSAPPSLLALAEAALADPALAQDRLDFGASAGRVAKDASLEDSLRQAVANGDMEFVQQFGERAIPVLEQALSATLDGLPQRPSEDPLHALIQLSERRAAGFALEHFDSAGYAFRRRVLGEMQANHVFTGDSWLDWPQPGEARQTLVPDWLLVLAKLLRDPETAREALPLAADVMRAEGLTPELTEALMAAAQGGDEEFALTLVKELSNVRGRVGSSSRRLFESLAQHENVLLRRLAARWLSAARAGSVLSAMASDPDELVRQSVAWSLRKRQEGEVLIKPVIDDQAIAALRLLVVDPSVEVRRAAVPALLELAQPLEPELYRAVVEDKDPEVRSKLAQLQHRDDDLVSDVLLSLAGDTDSGVRGAVNQRLADPATWARPATALAAAQLRLFDPTTVGSLLKSIVEGLATSDAGARILFAHAVQDPGEELINLILGSARHLASATGTGWKALLTLPDDVLAKTYVLLASRMQRPDLDILNAAMLHADLPRAKVWQAVLEDAEAPFQARLSAAVLLASGGGERLRSSVVALFSSGALRSRSLSEQERYLLSDLLNLLPEGESNLLSLAALREEAFNAQARLQIASFHAYAPPGPDVREITLAVLSRWLDTDDPSAEDAVTTALFNLRTLPEGHDPALLARALHNPICAVAAVETMSAVGDPVHLPALESAVSAEWVRDQTTQSMVQAQAVSALAAFPGEEATEALLRATTSARDSVRAQCLEALASRRQVEEERRLWQDSKEARLDRTGAVQRLLAQLRDADPAIRAEAARALGTLGALETLPTLIEALKDRDEGVRKAVRAALERLNSLPAKESAERQGKPAQDG